MGTKSLLAILPHPRIVAFPGHLFQIHVFEPRYRQMVEDCLENDRLLGVALGKASPRQKQNIGKSMENYFSSNHNTYHPAEVFGAGKVTLLREFSDGRKLIQVAIEKRFRLHGISQHIPYIIAEVEECQDIHPEKYECCSEAMKEICSILQENLGVKVPFPEQSTQTHDGIASFLHHALRSVLFDPAENQKLLEEKNLFHKIKLFLNLLQTHTYEESERTELQMS